MRTADERDDLDRELDELVERRLIVPLNAVEQRRYDELCVAEWERLWDRQLDDPPAAV